MQSSQSATDVPCQIFEKFLEELKNAGISSEIVERLRTDLLQERNLTETAIRSAMFPNQTES